MLAEIEAIRRKISRSRRIHVLGGSCKLLLCQKYVELTQEAKGTICTENGQSSKRTLGTSNRIFLDRSQTYGLRQWLGGSKRTTFD